MASTASGAAVAASSGDARTAVAGVDGATAAWLVALPGAAIAAVAILVLGPPLGALLSPARSPYTFLTGFAGGVHREPTEQARYLIAACVPLLGSLAILTSRRWISLVPRAAVVPVAVAGQLALACVVVASIAAQYRLHFGAIYTRGGQDPNLTVHYFKPATLGVAALLALGAAAVARSPSLSARAAAVLLPESRRRRLVVGGIALLMTVVWMLHAVHTDAEIGNAIEDVRYHLAFTLDETFAVLNGRTPLVDFTAQYASLWPYVIAVPMALAGKTVLAFTVTACVITALALLAIYGVLRRASPSSLVALLLYLPFLATSLFQIYGTFDNRSSVASYYASFPLRYALPFFVAWLTARRIERDRDDLAGNWLLFTIAGLTLLNNGDFGLAALCGSVAALLWTRPGAFAPAALARLTGTVALGLGTAVALVCLLTLVRAGALPQPERLVDYARLYAVGGFAMMPIPGLLGVHLLIYLTHAGALAVATTRVRRRAPNRVLTGMLAWAGVFGLGAGLYWVGRSHPDALKHVFSAWALSLALLTLAAIGELGARRRRTAIGALVVLFGFGVATCSLAQTPTPWGQIDRLTAPFVPSEEVPDPNPLAASKDPEARRFVVSLADGRSRFVVKRGAPVAILLTNGHRVADAYGIVNVSPNTGIESVVTVERVDAVIDALRAAGGNTIVLPGVLDKSIFPVLQRRGFEPLTPDGLRPYDPDTTSFASVLWPYGGSVIKWVDTRHLHPRALERPAEATQP